MKIGKVSDRKTQAKHEKFTSEQQEGTTVSKTYNLKKVNVELTSAGKTGMQGVYYSHCHFAPEH